MNTFMEIQRLVLPSFRINMLEDMYYRKNEFSGVISFSRKKICINKGEKISFDTYFNSMTVQFWKDKCEIKDLFYEIKGVGKALLQFCIHKNYSTQILYEEEILLSDEKRISLDFWKNISSGILYVQIIALTDIEIENFKFLTIKKNINEVRLGIVITHFNRKEYVIPAAKRIVKELIEDNNYKNDVSLIIVDNSNNLCAEEVPGSVLIHNKNTGGSGGFCRGLLYLKENNYTHCLFMDDDGACEIDSIRRTIAIYKLHKKSIENVAISGTLLLEKNTNIIHEKGAILFADSRIISLKNSCCIDRVDGLIEAEKESLTPNYGAWCYFCFRIKDVKYLPFPFFVRGDDMLFSIINKLNILTLNGVAVWIDKFDDKESPLVRYLSFRGTFLTCLLGFKITTREAVTVFLRWHLTALLSYNYESAEAVILALKDILKGPTCFVDDIQGYYFRNKIKSITHNEVKTKIENNIYKTCDIFNESILRKIFRIITINGLLIPSFLLKNTTVYQRLGWRASFRQIFGFKRVFFSVDENKQGYIVEHNKKQIIKGLAQCVYFSVFLIFNTNKIKRIYVEKSEEMMGDKFWYSQLKK